MKTHALALAASTLLWGLTFAAPQENQTFNGEIMDSACAKMGTHETMMQSNPNMKTAKDCSLACVKAGNQYVLYHSSTKTVYQLDDQKKPEKFAGREVTVTGRLDAASKTIHVADIRTVLEHARQNTALPESHGDDSTNGRVG
jgi:type 1 fimbria pilin